MSPKDHLIHRLKLLCAAHGGVEAVADKAGLSADSLKQILAGYALPSGAPRGVGPGSAKKLEAAFPGWAWGEIVAPAVRPAPAQQAQPPGRVHRLREASSSGWAVLDDLADIPEDEREALQVFIHSRAESNRAEGRLAMMKMRRVTDPKEISELEKAFGPLTPDQPPAYGNLIEAPPPIGGQGRDEGQS